MTHDIVVIGASQGGVEALTKIFSTLRADLGASIFTVLHIGDHAVPALLTVFGRHSRLPLTHPANGEAIEPRHIYIAPPGLHMRLGPDGRVALDRGPKVRHTRPAADPLFMSAAETYGARVIGVILSGGDMDGTLGARTVKAHGGLVVVQDPHEAPASGMPLSTLIGDDPDYRLSVDEIGPLLNDLCP